MKFLVAWLIGIILIAAFFYWIAWGWEGTGGYWWHRQSTAVQSSASQPITGSGLAALNASDRKPYIGQPFHLTNVPVQRKVGDRIFWIGTNSQSPILVILAGNQNIEQFGAVTTGSKVDVAGTVMKAPPTPDAASQWSLNDPDLAQLEKEGVYIQASEIYRSAK